MDKDATENHGGSPGSAPLDGGVRPLRPYTCWCVRCRPLTVYDSRMVVCPSCGDKRCVHAADHEAPCAKDDIYAHNAWVDRRQLDVNRRLLAAHLD